MVGDKYIAKDFFTDGINYIEKGEILTEKPAWNFEKECREDGEAYNELHHEKYGYICDVGSLLAEEYLQKYNEEYLQKYNEMIKELINEGE